MKTNQVITQLTDLMNELNEPNPGVEAVCSLIERHLTEDQKTNVLNEYKDFVDQYKNVCSSKDEIPDAHTFIKILPLVAIFTRVLARYED